MTSLLTVWSFKTIWIKYSTKELQASLLLQQVNLSVASGSSLLSKCTYIHTYILNIHTTYTNIMQKSVKNACQSLKYLNLSALTPLFTFGHISLIWGKWHVWCTSDITNMSDMMPYPTALSIYGHYSPERHNRYLLRKKIDCIHDRHVRPQHEPIYKTALCCHLFLAVFATWHYSSCSKNITFLPNFYQNQILKKYLRPGQGHTSTESVFILYQQILVEMFDLKNI